MHDLTQPMTCTGMPGPAGEPYDNTRHHRFRPHSVHAALVVAADLLILGTGFIIDMLAYAESADWLASVGEWVGFAVILVGAF